MSLQVPQPLIAQALQQDYNGLVNIILTDDSVHQAEALFQSVKSSLLSGQHCYIIVSEHEKSSHPLQMLSQYNLAHLSAEFQSLSAANPEILSRAKSLEMLQRIPLEANKLERLKMNRERLLDQIKERFAQYHIQITPEETLKELVLNPDFKAAALINLPLQQELNDKTIDHNLLRSYSALGQLYDDRFSFIQGDLVPAHIYESEETYGQYVKQVKSLKRSIQLVNEEVHGIKTALTNELSKKIDNEVELIKMVRAELSDYLPVSDLDSAGNKYVRIQKIISPLMEGLDILAVPLNTDQQYISLIIDQLDIVLYKSESIKSSKINSLLSRLTPFNSEDDKLDSLVSQVSELREHVEATFMIKDLIKKRYFNLASLYEDCEALTQRINHLIYILTDDQYSNYRLLQEELNCSQNLVHALLSEPEDNWGATLLSLYISSLQSSHSKLMHADHELINKYGQYVSLCRRILKTESEVLHNLWSDTRVDTIRQTTGRSIQQLSLSAETDDMSDILTQYFPVKIMTPEELDNHGVREGSKAIFLSNNNVNIQRLQVLSQNHHVVVLGSKLRNINRIQDQLSTQLLNIDTPAMSEYKSFNSMQSSDRLTQAKSLALAINMICDRFDVIQLRDKSVISLCNKVLSQKIIDMLPDHQVNLLYQNSSQYEDLVDAMIHEDRDIYVIHENGLLDERRLAHLDWQLQTIDQMHSANIKMINISTSQLIYDLDATLMNVFNAIVSSNTSELIIDEIRTADEPTTVPI